VKRIFFVCIFFCIFINAKPVKFVGNVISNGQKMISSKYIGYVSKIYVDIGDRVKRDDNLYEIESAEFDILKSQSNLMVEQAKLVVSYWKSRVRKLDKKRKIVQKNKATNFQFDLKDLESQADNAVAMLDAAKVVIKQSLLKTKEIMSVFNHLKMTSPSDGIIVERNIKVGDMVMPGMLTILLVDTEDLFVDISISESMLKHFYVGKKATIKIPSLSKTIKGKVKAIVPNSNFVTHKIKVRVSLDGKHLRILPGMYSEVYLDIDRKNNN